MLAQPATAVAPCTPKCSINSAVDAPNVRIVVCHPTSRTIHFLCSLPPCCRQLLYHPDQWLVHFRKIGFFCGPVIHLSINVNCVLTVPWRSNLIIPNSL